jgi:hypothetical protein
VEQADVVEDESMSASMLGSVKRKKEIAKPRPERLE